MESPTTKTLLCFDALNWMSETFWNGDADLQYCTDPWEALQYSHRTVGTFVRAARNADFDLVVVAGGSANDPDVRAKYEWRREEEILHEKRGVCLGADMLLADSFQSHGIRVVRPIDADANDVLAALANSVEGAIIVSRNRNFFRYDKALLVSRSFTVSKGKLLLEPPVTDYYARASRNPFTVRPHLALVDNETWCLGHVTKYRPSLKSHGRVDLGSSSSSDRKLGNLHVIARPLRAAVYAILGEDVALERIPEWSDNEERVVWTETEVNANNSLLSVLEDPISVVEWLVEHDTPVTGLEPWRAVERHFNICALAAELVAVSSQGAWTSMHKCMELFSHNNNIVKRTSRSSFGTETCVQQDHTVQDARTYSAERGTKDKQHQSLTPNAPPSSSSKARESIFGTGRPREEVLKERGKQNNQE